MGAIFFLHRCEFRCTLHESSLTDDARKREKTMASAAHNARPNRESVRKRIGERTYRAICSRDGSVCVYCGKDAIESGAHLQLDHLNPRSKGGADEPSNLVLACRSCNSRRQDAPLAKWCTFVGCDSAAIRRHARKALKFTSLVKS